MIIALVITVAMVTGDQQECDTCYFDLKVCSDPCRESGHVYVIPPTCNGVNCIEDFNTCWLLYCVIPEQHGDTPEQNGTILEDEGSGNIEITE